MFAEVKPYSFLASGPKEPWAKLPWWMPTGTERPRHFGAAKVLGSYQNGAIWQMASTGRLRCQWCGHEDGVEPDYVVVTGDQ
ncbi:hypothetical protein U91I_03771 [alpha proteobacterium U9-1i]|nr:hypothetical protein U91I_03771 [alpha proteobacterium U9-1i]